MIRCITQLNQTFSDHPPAVLLCCCCYCRWTTSRAFRTSFWKELGKFLLIFGIVGLLNIAFGIAQVATCPLPPDPTAAAPAGPPAPPTKACFILTIISQLGSYLSIGCWNRMGCSHRWAPQDAAAQAPGDRGPRCWGRLLHLLHLLQRA